MILPLDKNPEEKLCNSDRMPDNIRRYRIFIYFARIFIFLQRIAFMHFTFVIDSDGRKCSAVAPTNRREVMSMEQRPFG